MNEDLKALLVGSGLVTYVVVFVVAISLLATFLYLAFYADILNLKREATQHSNQYVQSKVTELVESYDQYQQLETKKQLYSNSTIVKSFESQQESIVNRMCNALNLIPQDIQGDVVPHYIQSFLKEKCS